MVDTLIPLNAPVNGDPKYAARAARQTLVGVPLSGATAARPLGARSGVRPGTPASTVTVTLSGSTPNWAVNPHAGAIDTQSPAAGPYEYAFDAQKTGALAAQDGSNARVDLVCVLPFDTDEDQSGDRKVDIVTVTGTANGSLAAPAAPARAMVLARVNVPKAGSGTNPTVTWVAPYLTAAGGVIPVDTAGNLLLITGHPGQVAHVFGDPTSSNNGDYQWSVSLNTWFKAGGTASLLSAAPAPTAKASSGQETTLMKSTVTMPAAGDVWIAFTSLSQISVNGTSNNWAGNLAVRVDGVQVGGTRRVGNLASNDNSPVPTDRMVHARLAAGARAVTVVLTVDSGSSTSPFINNPQIEVWQG
jgi:hypothetical protein